MLLFERLLNKPIPWGIELLFKKIIKGESYNLLNKNFILNLNGGMSFIKSINEFIADKNYSKYTVFRNMKMHNNINMNISSSKEVNKKEKSEQIKKK